MFSISPAPLGITAIAVSVVFVFLDIVAIALRVWARKIKKRAFDATDYLIFGALFFATADMVTKGFEMSWGAGEHLAVVMEEDPRVLIPLQQITYAQYFIWGITILLVKLSILLLYRGIFHCMVYTVIAIYAAMAVCVATWILQVGILFGSCKPIALNWDPTTVGSCYFKGVTEYVIAMSSNLAMDIVVVLIPAPEVWRLKHVSIRKKIGISCIFGLGIVTCILVGLRFKYLYEMNLADATHDGVPSGIIASVELYVGIICACLPVLPPAFIQAGRKVQNTYAMELLTRKASKGSSLGDGKAQSTAVDSKEPNYDHIQLNLSQSKTQGEV